MHAIFAGITSAGGGSYTLAFDRAYPLTVNDTTLVHCTYTFSVVAGENGFATPRARATDNTFLGNTYQSANTVPNLLAALPGKPKVGELSRFPGNLIDIAIVVDKDVAAVETEKVIVDAGAPEVTTVRLFDVYEGDQIASSKKSLAYALELRADDRTLTDAEASAVRDRIVAALAERFGAELRG